MPSTFHLGHTIGSSNPPPDIPPCTRGYLYMQCTCTTPANRSWDRRPTVRGTRRRTIPPIDALLRLYFHCEDCASSGKLVIYLHSMFLFCAVNFFVCKHCIPRSLTPGAWERWGMGMGNNRWCYGSPPLPLAPLYIVDSLPHYMGRGAPLFPYVGSPL